MILNKYIRPSKNIDIKCRIIWEELHLRNSLMAGHKRLEPYRNRPARLERKFTGV